MEQKDNQNLEKLEEKFPETLEILKKLAEVLKIPLQLKIFSESEEIE